MSVEQLAAVVDWEKLIQHCRRNPGAERDQLLNTLKSEDWVEVAPSFEPDVGMMALAYYPYDSLRIKLSPPKRNLWDALMSMLFWCPPENPHSSPDDLKDALGRAIAELPTSYSPATVRRACDLWRQVSLPDLEKPFVATIDPEEEDVFSDFGVFSQYLMTWIDTMNLAERREAGLVLVSLV